jgi:hypothetical protein
MYTEVSEEFAASVFYLIQRPFCQITFVKSQTIFVLMVIAVRSSKTHTIYITIETLNFYFDERASL